MTEWIVNIILVGGSLFMLLAAVGIVRMPDLYTRMHASTKAASLGAGMMLLAAALHFGTLAVVTKALATVLFVFLTAPVAAHMIGRAGYFLKVPQWEGTVADELKACVVSTKHAIKSDPSQPSTEAIQAEAVIDEERE